jgi:hypothetical protein
MTRRQHAAIRAAYLAGEPLDRIAAAAGCSETEADAYLSWWVGEGAPGADTSAVPAIRAEEVAPAWRR